MVSTTYLMPQLVRPHLLILAFPPSDHLRRLALSVSQGNG